MGLFRGLSFSWKRAVGITSLKNKVVRATGVPVTKQGIERKVGRALINFLFGKRR